MNLLYHGPTQEIHRFGIIQGIVKLKFLEVLYAPDTNIHRKNLGLFAVSLAHDNHPVCPPWRIFYRCFFNRSIRNYGPSWHVCRLQHLDSLLHGGHGDSIGYYPHSVPTLRGQKNGHYYYHCPTRAYHRNSHCYQHVALRLHSP